MKIKTSELTGAALDWEVAQCEDIRIGHPGFWTKAVIRAATDGTECPWPYSISWAQGGPIIEREQISIRQWANVPIVHAYMPQDDAPWASDGTSPLIAAMRCYVASKLGDEVDVPEGL